MRGTDSRCGEFMAFFLLLFAARPQHRKMDRDVHD
jgi:hypothetical protein